MPTLSFCRPSEERSGLGIAAAQLVGRQSSSDPERVGRLRRQPFSVPHPASRSRPRHPLHQQARGVHQSIPASEKIRRPRQPHRSGDHGTAQEDVALIASFRNEAAGETCRLSTDQLLDYRSGSSLSKCQSYLNLYFPSIVDFQRLNGSISNIKGRIVFLDFPDRYFFFRRFFVTENTQHFFSAHAYIPGTSEKRLQCL